jgi:hypothetical protein
MARGKEQIAMDFLNGFLTPRSIDPERFYKFLQELEKIEYLEDVEPNFAGGLESSFEISAKYTGDVRLHGTKAEGVAYEPSEESQRRIEEIYKDISERTGFRFYDVNSVINVNYCYATVLLNKESEGPQVDPTFRLINNDKEKSLIVRLYTGKYPK